MALVFEFKCCKTILAQQDNAGSNKTILGQARQCWLKQDNAGSNKTMLAQARQCWVKQDNAVMPKKDKNRRQSHDYILAEHNFTVLK